MKLTFYNIPNLKKVKLYSIIRFIILILLLLPDDFYSFCPIYLSNTPSEIPYQWLNYSFNPIHLIICIIGLYYIIKNKDKWFVFVALFLFIREFIFFICNYNSCINNSAYEIYLALFTGYAVFKFVENNSENIYILEHFFWTIILLNIFTVFIAPFFGSGIINESFSRFNAVNLDVGSTGTICSIMLLHCIFGNSIHNRIIILFISITALFLSGSRINLLLIIFVCIIGATIYIKRTHVLEKKWIKFALSFIFLSIILLILLAIINPNILFNNGLIRMFESFNLNKMENDGSLLGRTSSILAGIDILKNNIWGISGYFINLQYETMMRGFPTFPHSMILDYYILLGPIVIIGIYYVVICLIKLYKKDLSQFLILFYLTLFITLSGGPVINFKIIFFYFMIIYISFYKEKYIKIGNIYK